jgi:hypothetical protein
MTIHTLKTAAAIAVFTLSLIGGATFAPTIALADDDEIYCFDFKGANGQDEIECDTIGNFKAECALTDPDTTTDHCKHVTSQFRGGINKLTNGGGNSAGSKNRR